MTPQTTTEKRTQCPSCGKKAKRVSPVTLRALLQQEYAQGIAGAEYSCCESNGGGCKPITGDTGWRFCDSPDCDVVYFSEEGHTKFTKSQLKVAVGVKEKAGERPLCYCFGHSVASIKDELRTKGRSDALEDIRAKMKDPGCRCETENPSGACCLGSVTKGIQIAQEELGMDESSVTPAKPPGSSTGRGETIAKLGTLASAIMASACCWLPLVLLAVGVSGAGIAATLEAYRPLFMVVTFGFLGAAFYFTYRPKKVAAAAGHGCCDTEPAEAEGCCAPTGKRRFNMLALNKLMLWGVTVLAVAFLFFPSYVGALLGSSDGNTVTTNMNQAVLKVEGMTCEGCAATVAQAIRGVPGVLAVEVSYEKQQAVVGTEICCSIPQEKILAALGKVGYSGTFVDSTGSSPAATGQSAGCCVLPKAGEESDTPPATGSGPVVRTIFKIDGMTCEGCAAGLSEAIRQVSGVRGVQVDFKTGRAVVESEGCCPVPQQRIVSAVKAAGFEASPSSDLEQAPVSAGPEKE